MGDADVSTGGGEESPPQLCLVCESNAREVMFVACGHLLLCDGCAARLLERRDPCPVCRVPVLAAGGTRFVGPGAAPSYQRDAVDPEVRARALAAALDEDDDEDEEEALPWAVTAEGLQTIALLCTNEIQQQHRALPARP
jgi:hypothetical protein